MNQLVDNHSINALIKNFAVIQRLSKELVCRDSIYFLISLYLMELYRMNSTTLFHVKFGRSIFSTYLNTLFKLSSLITLSFLTACSDSSDDTEGVGYFKLYNASANSPKIYLEIDDEEITQASFSESSTLYPIESSSYQLELTWKEDTNSYNDFYQQDLNISDEDISLVVVSGDFEDTEVTVFEYYDEQQDLIDDEEQERFALNFLNLTSPYENLDLYISSDDQTFNEAILMQSLATEIISDSQRFELDSYILYITESGSNEVIFESGIMDFFSTTQYVLAIRDNTGPGDSPIAIDQIGRSGSSITISDKDASAEIRVYNGLEEHYLLESFENNIDINISGLNDQQEIISLARKAMSTTIEVAAGDYSLDLLSSETGETITSNHFVSLDANQDKTLFVYLSEEYEDSDNDSTTPDETKIYLNSLPVENSNRISLFDHQINIINLVQDADQQFSSLQVYFVRSDETVSSAEYSLSSTHVNPKTILLPNNTYQVNVIAEIDQSDRLIIFDSLTLDADSGDLFMLIEEDEQSSEGYSIQFIAQRN